MPTQTITIAATANDGYQDSGTTFDSTVTIIYVFGPTPPENLGASFPIATAVPAGSTVNPSYFRVSNQGAEDSGSSTINLQTQSVDPASAAAWSNSNLPSAATALRARNIGAITWAEGYYFGSADTNASSIAQDIQDLVDSYGGIAVGERVNIFIEWVSGTGYPAFRDLDTTGTSDMQLFVDWTEGGDSEDIAAAGSLSITGAADLDATGRLLAAGALSISGAADLDGAGALLAAGALSISGAADLDAAGNLLAAGALSISGAADLDALGTLAAAGALSITGVADLASGEEIDLLASGSLVIAGAAALNATGSLIAAGSVRINGAASLGDGSAAFVRPRVIQYVPTKSPMNSDPALRGYLEREFQAVARAMSDLAARITDLE